MVSQNTIIGKAEPVIGTATRLFETEDNSEYQNNVSIRRVKLLGNQEMHKVQQVSKSYSHEQEMPDHVRPLYEKSVQGRSTADGSKFYQPMTSSWNTVGLINRLMPML